MASGIPKSIQLTPFTLLIDLTYNAAHPPTAASYTASFSTSASAVSLSIPRFPNMAFIPNFKTSG